MQTNDNQVPPAASRFTEFPALAKLDLVGADLDELARQGFLALERRHGRPVYKLRFRRAGRQVVRCVGGTDVAALVAAELNTLQINRRKQRELDLVGRAARQMLRDAKTKLEPLVLEQGFKFHGRAIRRPRRPAKQLNATFSTLS